MTKLNDLFTESNTTLRNLSDRGMVCLVKAILDVCPILLLAFENYPVITNYQILNCFGQLDLSEEELSKVLNQFMRYDKLWAFS